MKFDELERVHKQDENSRAEATNATNQELKAYTDAILAVKSTVATVVGKAIVSLQRMGMDPSHPTDLLIRNRSEVSVKIGSRTGAMDAILFFSKASANGATSTRPSRLYIVSDQEARRLLIAGTSIQVGSDPGFDVYQEFTTSDITSPKFGDVLEDAIGDALNAMRTLRD